MPFAEDMSAFFDTGGFAHDARWSELSAKVILDMPTEDILGGRGQSNEYMMTLPAKDFPGIMRGATVQIGLTAYTVREVRLLDDGAIKMLSVTKL
jgi:hypothetical protein